MSRIFVVASLIILCCTPARAEVVETDLPPTQNLFDAPSLELNIPKPVAIAIATVESGLKPWALNIEGRPFRFDSKEKALEKAEEAWEAGRSFDVGLMQVNKWWLQRYGVSLEAALDPVANVYFGSWILKQEMARHGDLKAAIGAYHSPTPTRASQYADQVMAALKRGPQHIKSAKAPKKQSTANADRNAPDVEKALTPSGSTMLILSQKVGVVTSASMKAVSTSPVNSMKIKPRQ